jgi:drug/metabolite transporter (DMT)-like permease
MNRNTAFIIAIALGFVAVIFYVSPSFNILPFNYAFFFGFVATLAAGFVWVVRSRLKE